MRSCTASMRVILLAMLCQCFLLQAVGAQSDVPAITSTIFKEAPVLLVPFEDSNNVLILDETGHVHLSSDEGKAWAPIKAITEPIVQVITHGNAKSTRAFALSAGTTHFFTKDAGSTWSKFQTQFAFAPSNPLAFHGSEDDWILFRGIKSEKLDGWIEVYTEHAFYTKDSFKSAKPLLSFVQECIWAKPSAVSTAPKEKVFCLQFPEDLQKEGIIFRDPSKLRLVTSDSYFPNGKGDLIDFGGDTSPMAIGASQAFLVAVAGSKDAISGVDLHISTDGQKFSKAYFPADASSLSKDAYTVLDSSEHRLLVDVLPILSSTKKDAEYGNLYISNSDGTQFTKSLPHTNRNHKGRIDFERIDAEVVSGTILANVVENWKEVESTSKAKQVTSRISYDDGARWNLLKPPPTDVNGDDWTCKVSKTSSEVDPKCALHFHSKTEFHNVGKVFSTLAAPGFIVGVGNVGPHLLDYEKGDTFLSSDGGMTWVNAARGPHKYELADMGSIVILVPDKKDANTITYSTKRGAQGSWKTVNVAPKGVSKWSPIATNIDPDSTSSSMIIVAQDSSALFGSYYVIQLDFGKAQSRQCDFDAANPGKSKDFELWTPKQIGSDGKDVCVMGEDVGYYRRKQDAECYVGRKFKHPEISRKACSCTTDDYECDFHFRQDDSVDRGKELKCTQFGLALDQPTDCPVGKQYKGTSGYRKIPGNKCAGGKKMDEPTMRDCRSVGGGVSKPPKGVDPTTAIKVFDDKIKKVLYMKESHVVLLLKGEGDQLFRSDDEGVTWNEPAFFKGKYPLLLMGAHDSAHERVLFATSEDIYLSKDRLASNPSLIAPPAKYNQLGIQIIDFHPSEPDYLVFVGSPRNCPGASGCFTEVFLTLDSGKSWLNNKKPVETWATKCVWAWDGNFGSGSKLKKDAVFCSSFKNKNGNVGQDVLGARGSDENPLQLVVLTNGGKDKKVLIEKGVIMFYVVDTVLVVLLEEGGELKLQVSSDGETLVDTEFPPDMPLQHNGFTVLESKTNGIFLDIQQSRLYGSEFGHLFKSNSNGVFYNRILENTNRNKQGFVDFEKMKGVPGVLLANQLQNPKEISGGNKVVKSLISFDDGSTWQKLKAPEKDSNGDPVTCQSDCALNIYLKIAGSTGHFGGEGKASVLTSAHAAGFMVAVGSIGSSLDAYKESNMYLTKDAGRSWTEIRKDAHKWAIGDHGAMIVMVDDERATDTLVYSWNYGQSWATFKFSEKPIRVDSVMSEPSSTSLKFIIYGIPSTSSRAMDVTVISIDFSKVLPRVCGKPSKSSGDFVEWTPADKSGNDRCFLGQDVSYWRRKPEADCQIGREFQDIPGTSEVCKCTDTDYECDFNFFRDAQNNCVPVTNYVDANQPKNCKPGTEFLGSSGYRKIPLSKCKDGVDRSQKVKRTCGSISSGPGELKLTTTILKHPLSSYFYFNQSSSIIMRDEFGLVFASSDAGRSWNRPSELKAEDYESIMLDPYRSNTRAYVLDDDSTTQHWTNDKGKSFKTLSVPVRANKLGAEPLILHATEPSYLMWVGEKDCASPVSPNCHSVAYVSTNNGYSWKEIATYVTKCSFAREPEFNKPSKDTIFCQEFDVKTGNQHGMNQKTARKLKRSTNLGGSWTNVLDNTISYATAGEYMVAAQLDIGAAEMKMFSSIDGVTWTQGTFEDDEKFPDYGYTLLDASTGPAFLEVFASKGMGAEYGTLYKSTDSAAANFKVSLENVNQDHKGYTDFEKVLGIRGIGLANVVINKDQVRSANAKKQIRTQITFNDGDTWKPLAAPAVGSDGKSYDCTGDCYLNLHHFTERSDSNDLFSSESAVGFMIGVGNVGAHLSAKNDGDTFLTRDAGLTWVEIAKEAHLYEFGDQGGIILLANDEVAVDELKYSLNHGKSFSTIKIGTHVNGGKLRVTHIFTEPYGASSSFVVYGKITGGSSDHTYAAIQLDFTKVWSRECKLLKGDVVNSDYEVWSPTGQKTGDESCMLGEQIEMYRRKSDKECHTKGFFEKPVTLVKTCQCTVDDFTCDVGFSRNSTHECTANQGYVVPQPQCSNGKLQYSTGYVKVKGTKCQGGQSLDIGRVDSCAAAISFGGWLGILTAVIGIPYAVSYFVINKKRGGRIRLVDHDDDLEPNSNGSWISKTGQILRSSTIIAMGLVEIGLSKAREGYDWVKQQVNKRSGYMPLHTNYNDVDLETDPALLFDDDE
ncbi:vacuolar protein sorting/targeting protein PEP1 [Chytriomyces hyalinus]|nr:vacuolar protein sorting/targeting protein PEP1 [Chytriomyces hyalinus]